MSVIEWNASKHSVNIKHFDADHQKLFELFNDIADKMTAGEGNSIILCILLELRKYGKKHFIAEEVLMEKYAYPETSIHKQEHVIFTEKVDRFIERYKAGDNKLSIESFFFLKDWLNKHILETDKKYIVFFHKKGIE